MNSKVPLWIRDSVETVETLQFVMSESNCLFENQLHKHIRVCIYKRFIKE